MLERSGMAEDLLDTIGQLFGTIRGGLAYAVIFVGALLAATTGVVAASVISMGLISLPIMLRYGYDRRVATGVIAASGTLAQIIPPSLVLIVMADQLGRSVGDMYEGAFIPGMVLASLYASYIFLVTKIAPNAAPGLPADAVGFREPNGSRGLTSLAILTVVSALVGYLVDPHPALPRRRFRGPDHGGVDPVCLLRWRCSTGSSARSPACAFCPLLAQQVTFVMVPPLFLIFLVLGTIFIGVATPTEGGAMGATGAILLAIFKRWLDRNPNRFNLTLLRSAVEVDGQAFRLRGLHPGRRAHLLADLLRRERARLGRASADIAARRAGGLPRLRQHPRVPARLLPRLLRDRLHRHPADRTGGREDRHRPDLARA